MRRPVNAVRLEEGRRRGALHSALRTDFPPVMKRNEEVSSAYSDR